MGLRVFVHAALCFLLISDVRVTSGQLIHDPCDVYGTLVDQWRDPEADADPTHCDDRLAAAWYTFRLDKDPAVIPTQCLQDNTCGATLSLHVDLEGQQLPQVGDNVSAVLCGSYNVLGAIDCCVQRQRVDIKRCSDDVIIYYLRPQSVCPAAVCATRLRDVIPAQYLAKPGDRPQSLPAVTMTTSAETETSSALSDTTSPDTTSSANTSSDTTSSSLPDEITRRLMASSSTTPVTTATASTGQASPSSPAPSAIPPATSSSPRVLSSSVNTNSSGDNATDSPVSSLPDDESSLLDDESFTHNRSEVATTTDGQDARSENENTLMTLHNTTVMTSLTPVMTSVAPVMTVVTSATAPPSAEPRTTTVTSVPTAGVASTSPSTTTAVPQGASTRLPTQRSFLPSTSTGSPPLPTQSPQAVRFVLRGAFEEDLFRDQLEQFAHNVSDQLRQSDVSRNFTYISLTPHSSRDNITVVDVAIKDPLTNDTVPAAYLLDLMRNSNFKQQISVHTYMHVVKMCAALAALDRCDDSRAGRVMSSQSLFTQNQAVFIAVIAVATLCLLILFLGLLYVRCRQQGTWVLPPDHEEKGPEPGGVESPMTDAQITRGEGDGVGVVTANGHERAHTPDDIPAADEDNGWVVPIDQAPPPASDWLVPQTEDTQF